MYRVIQPFYKKMLLVLQDAPTITQSTAIYWDIDNIIDNIIEQQGNYKSINNQIRDAVIIGYKVLEEYTCKIDTETLILYTAAVLDPRVKTEFLKVHLQEGAEAVIDNLQVYFKELSPVEERLPNYPLGAVADIRSSAANSTSFVGRSGHGLKIATSRQQIIQKDYYALPATALDEIDE
jgi:hypothetical protein